MAVQSFMVGYISRPIEMQKVESALEMMKNPEPIAVCAVRDGDQGCAMIAPFQFTLSEEQQHAMTEMLKNQLALTGDKLFLSFGDANLLDAPHLFFSLREASARQADIDKTEDPSRQILSHNENLSPIVLSAIDYVVKNYAESTNLDYVARSIHVHPTYLSDLFRRETGYTFTGFVNRYRIFQARRLLRSPQCRIQEVSTLTGFHDQHYFSRVFKKMCGMTPVEYRAESFHNVYKQSQSDSSE